MESSSRMKPRLTKAIAAVGCILALVPAAQSAEYYLSATGGSLSNAGTRQAPLPSLEAVASANRQFSAGDTLILLAGHHGAPTIRTVNTAEVLVRPDSGADVTLKNLTLSSARFWTIRGLAISPENQSPFERVTLVTISGGSDNVVESCTLYSTRDGTGWSASEWTARSCNGISMSGTRNTVRDNTLLFTNFAIAVSGTYNLVQRNVVNHFMSDGMRGLGDYCTFEYNVVKNIYEVNSNHDDGFQSWSSGTGGVGTGVVRGVVLRGNTFINDEGQNHPLRGTIQGVGCFDGFFEDWVVENNVVFADHYHGITLLGARNCRVVNNTVLDPITSGSGRTWIRVAPHKNGTASTGNLVRNNIATSINCEAGIGTVDSNLDITTSQYASLFANPGQYDVRLRAGTSAIDAGNAQSAPSVDRNGNPRPRDGNGDGVAAWDLGAFEFSTDAQDVAPAAPTDFRAVPAE